MQFKDILLAAAASAIAYAQPQLTNSNFNIVAGQPIDITWTGAQGPVTLLLKNGPSTDLVTVGTIASGQTGTSFSWTPSTNLDTGFYALEIRDSSNVPNYSPQFTVTGATAAPVTATSSTSVSSTQVSSTRSSTVSSTSTLSSTGSSTSSGSSSTTSGVTTSTATTIALISTTVGSNSSSTLTVAPSATGSFTNSTTNSTTLSKTASQTSSTSLPTVAPSSSAAGLASPVAFVFLAIAAIVMLN